MEGGPFHEGSPFRWRQNTEITRGEGGGYGFLQWVPGGIGQAGIQFDPVVGQHVERILRDERDNVSLAPQFHVHGD